GVSDVFDLTVDDDAHTFVANGVVVHNKSILPECTEDADGGVRSELRSPSCRCANRTWAECDDAGVCGACGAPRDGGSPDAGP
ncbi:MAG: hypothetical protein JNG84_02635, partial [Archangium sp.]|nr:hypothetical protein [Archangium sp.]